MAREILYTVNINDPRKKNEQFSFVMQVPDDMSDEDIGKAVRKHAAENAIDIVWRKVERN